MKIALAAKKFTNNDINNNLKVILNVMEEASELALDFVCFGEAFLQGFDALSWKYEIDKNIGISLDDEIISKIKRHSLKTKCGVMFGYIEKENQFLYSSYLVIKNNDIIYNYRRISRGWKEYSKTDYHYLEGTKTDIIDIEGKKFVFSLCGDLWDKPKSFKKNYDYLIWPVYCNYSIDEWNNGVKTEYCEHAKGITKNVLYINSLSDNPDSFGGCYYFKDGEILKSLEVGNDGLLIVDLD